MWDGATDGWMDERTDGLTDRRTDRPTDGRTDIVTYRVACTQLNMREGQTDEQTLL